MQENNFERIISQWRRMSGEQVESSKLVSMSGDSHPLGKKGEENEKDLLVPEGSRAPAAIAGASAAAATSDQVVSSQSEEKQEFIGGEKETLDKACGYSDERKIDIDYLENNEPLDKLSDEKGEKDKVDSVYLRPPPSHKARSNASTPSTTDDEECIIKCLYYTMQCCDCVLM